MTVTPAEIQRKVRQLDNEVQSIYEILHSIAATQTRHGTRLDGLDQRFDGVDQRFDAADKRFDGIDGKLDEILTIVRER
jgi:hypothetical protein